MDISIVILISYMYFNALSYRNVDINSFLELVTLK